MGPASVGGSAVPVLELDVGGGIGGGATAERVLAEVHKVEIFPSLPFHGVDKGIDGPVTGTFDGSLHTLKADLSDAPVALGFIFLGDAIDILVEQLKRLDAVDEFGFEGLVDLHHRKLLLQAVGHIVDVLAYFAVHRLRKIEAVLAGEDKGHASFPTLGINADDRFVIPPDIGRVDKEVGDLPKRFFLVHLPLFSGIHALFNGILVGSAEGGKDEFSGIGQAGRNLHAGDSLIHLDNLRQVPEVEPGPDPLRVEVQGDGDDVEVAGSFPVTEEGALDAIGTGHQAKHRRSDSAALIIVCVERKDGGIPSADISAEPLDLVRVNIWGGDFYGGGKIEDNGVLGRSAPRLHDGLADLEGIIDLSIAEALRGILKGDLGLGQLGEKGADEKGAANGDLLDRLLIEVEGNFPLDRGGGIVEVDDGFPGTLETLKGPADEVLSGLDENLDGDVFGNTVFLDEPTGELEFGFAGAGEAHLDLFKTDAGQHLEHLQFLVNAHGDGEGLVPIAKVDTAPDRGGLEGLIRPPSIRQGERRKGFIFCDGGALHG